MSIIQNYDIDLHCAHVYLNELKHRRHDPVNRFFYWTLFNAAQNCRKRYTESKRHGQMTLMGL
jgi:hypothetical protein